MDHAAELKTHSMIPGTVDKKQFNQWQKILAA